MVIYSSVSVVVPTYNRLNNLKRTIDSLIRQDYPSYEIIVVDDGSSDGTGDYIKKISSENNNLKCILQENRGPAAARNSGVAASNSELICFTDDDCVANRDWISNLVKGFINEKIGGVGGRIISSGDTLLEKYAEDAGILNQEKYIASRFLITANAAYRKDALTKINGFDKYRIDCEDIDLSIRVQLEGYTLVYAPDAIIIHDHRLGYGGLFRQQYRNAKGLGQLRKKYQRDFNFFYNTILIFSRILSKILFYPLLSISAFRSKNVKYALLKPLLDITILTSHLLVFFVETIFGSPYPGEKVLDKIPFIEDQSPSGLFKKLKSKIT